MGSPDVILRYLAALAPSRRSDRAASFEAVSTPRDFVWLGDHPIHWGASQPGNAPEPPPGWFDRSFGRKLFDTVSGLVDETATTLYPYRLPRKMRADGLERLAALDALDPHHEAVRAGAGWLIGRRRVDASDQSVFFPLLSRRVRLHDAGGIMTMQPEWRSDLEVHPLFTDLVGEDDVEKLDVHGPGVAFLSELVQRAGWPSPTRVDGATNPLELVDTIEQRARQEGEVLYLAPGAAVYASAPEAPTTIAAGLDRWAHEGLGRTAFARLYGTGGGIDDDDGPDRPDSPVLTPLPTNERQRAAIVAGRHRAVNVVSGPPGTGKTHLVVAAAVDAVARGKAVLIATQSDHAAESVCELLDRYPTPPHLRFGRAEHRQRVAERLASGRHQAPSAWQLEEAEAREATDRERRDERESIIRTALEREVAVETALRHRASMGMLTADAPGVLAEGLDLAHVAQLLTTAGNRRGFLRRLLANRAERRLRVLVQARAAADLRAIERAVEFARAERDAEHALATGGTALDDFWAELAQAEQEWQESLAEVIDVRRRHTGRLQRRRARSSVAALANVLRAGVARRSELLSDIESDDFLDLLPLWVGTLDEVERTLPVIPGLFDLVVLDEASQIDQLQAAGAICRAERITVVGDPRQLRHVSFVGDDRMSDALSDCGIEDPTLRRILDVRRNSIFDVAAAAGPVIWLDEHFRCVPHLIDFSAKHFYDDELRLMTQHPQVEGHDAIDQVQVPGVRIDGVNQAEVDRIQELIAEIGYQEATGSIGVVTPFRKQADAIVSMMLDRFSLAQIRQFGLRAGTVHSFQGSERDTMIISLAVGSDDLSRSLRFIEDPGLFNVMVTRARRRIVLVHSFDPNTLPRGLLADYFRFADDPPTFEEYRVDAAPWVRQLADALAAPDLRVVTDYPVAGWSIDLALSNDHAAIGVECTVHPDGPAAHIERHLTLRRAGWTLTDAFPSRWMLRPEEAAAQLAAQLHRRQAETLG